jgi:hypothetical protein
MDEMSADAASSDAGRRLATTGLALCAASAVPMYLAGGRDMILSKVNGLEVTRALETGVPRASGVIVLIASIALFVLSRSRVWRVVAACAALAAAMLLAFLLLGARIDDGLGSAARNSFRTAAWLTVVALALLLVGALCLTRSAGVFDPIGGKGVKGLVAGLLAFVVPPLAPAAISVARARSASDSGKGAARAGIVFAMLGLAWFAALIVAGFVAHP